MTATGARLPEAVGVEHGVFLLSAANGVSFLLDDLRKSGAAGEGGQGWWLRCLRGPAARRRYWKARRAEGPPVEWHVVGTYPTARAAKQAALEHSLEARRGGVA